METIPDWLALLLLVLANLLLGALLLARLQEPAAPPVPTAASLLATLFAALALGVALSGWLALLLAELGLFSAGRLAFLWLLLIALLLLLPGQRLPRLHLPATERPELLLLAGWLVVAAWLFFRPHEFIQGAADAGVYVNLAANVANRGSLIYEEPLVAEMDPALFPAFMRERQPAEGTRYYLLPAFNLDDDRPGLVIPDFFPLHPVWQAVAYDLGGIWAALRLPGLWALLGSLAIYLVLRPAAGRWAALLGLAAMSVNALQVWFARYPVTETLTQYLLWTSLFALGAWLAGQRPARLWALLAALTLGQLFLVRIDTLFLLAVPAGIALWLLLRPGAAQRRQAVWYFAPLLLLTLHAALHTTFFSAPYLERLLNYGRRTIAEIGLGWFLLLVGVAAAVGALLWVRYRPVAWTIPRRRLLAGATLLLVALAAYGWFVRPVMGQEISYPDWYGGGTIILTDHENLLRLGWYLSPVGVWLGVAGAGLLLWRVERRTLPILLVGLFFSLLYLWRIQNNPHQVYAMRRYVPVVMPFFIFAAAFLLGHLLARPERLWRAAGLALTLLWLGGLGWSARGFISQVDYRGLVDEMAALDQRLPAGSLLIFNDQNPVSLGDVIGTPLHYQHGHDVLTLRNPDAVSDAVLLGALQEWQDSGRALYWVGNPAFLDAHDLAYTAETITLPAVFLETPYEYKPREIINSSWTLQLHRLAESEP